MSYDILMWAFLGVVTGLVATVIVSKANKELVQLLLLGLVGALVGGALGKIMTGPNQVSFNSLTLFVAMLGAVTLIGFYKNISPLQ